MTRKDLPDTLFSLLSHYSPSGQEAEAVDYLVARMQELGYKEAFVDQAGNAVGVIGNGARQIVLLGHIDTVPGDIPVRMDGDILYGRGAVDAKGPLAAFVDCVASVEPVAGWQYVVIGAVDEERDSAGARYVVSQYQPVYAIVGEPSRWDRVTLGYKGSAWAEVSVRRPMAHSAHGEESACEGAFRVWEELLKWVGEYNAGKQRLFDQIILSLQGFSSGDDGFESWAGLQVGARLPLEVPPEAWYQRFSQVAGDASVEPTGFPIPAYLVEKNTPLVRAFLAGVREGGGRPGFVVKTGTADMNIVAPTWGCPVVAYGPGDSSLDHTALEHISIAEYARAVEVLKSVLYRLTTAQGHGKLPPEE